MRKIQYYSMIINLTWYIFWLQCFYTVAYASPDLAPNNIKKEAEKYGSLNILIEDLQNQNWNDDEVPCVELLTKIMRNVQNSTVWATWIWDSMQNPVGHLYGSKANYGNYDECLEFPWEKVHPDMKTHYCLADIQLSEADLQMDDVDLFGNVNNYLRAKTKHHLKFNTLVWGVCTPVTCKPHSVAKFVNVLFRQTHLGLSVDKPKISVNHCDTAEDKEAPHSLGYYWALCFLVFAVLGTLWATNIVNSSGDHRSHTDFIKAFYIPRNVDTLTKITNNDIRSMFGVRVISCCVVTGLHVLWFMKSSYTTNALALDKAYDIVKPMTFTMEMVVDTFLYLSGLLFVRSLLTDGLEKFNPLKVLVKRYIRIVWPFVILVLVTSNLLPHWQRGPAVHIYGRETNACLKTWWASLLMIQNYYDPENMCHSVVWSNAVDFHLSILATMIAWVFLRNKRLGSVLFCSGFIISIAIPAILVYSDLERYHPLAVDFRLTDEYRKTILLNETYIATHFRAGSYFVGMAMGYMMYKYNPVTHRNIITKKYSIFGFCLFLAMFLGMLTIGDVIVKSEYSPLVTALYLSLKRIIWAVMMGLLITICEYGTLPLVNSFLSWSAVAPISRLTTGIHLVHTMFGCYMLYIARTPNQYDVIGLVVVTLAMTVLSSVVSLFLWVFFEAPMKNLVSLLLRSRTKQIRRGEVKEGNGYETNNFEEFSKKKTK